MLKQLLILAAAIACTTHAHAQPFTYQGQLRSGGQITNGMYDFRFAVFAAQNGGAVLGTLVTHSGVDVIDGTFTVAIDPGPDIFTGAPRWLEIHVRPRGAGTFTRLTPRQLITPAPYATRALEEHLVPTGAGLMVDPLFERLFVNRASPITPNEYFGITASTASGEYGGMYVNASHAQGRPFYGYSLAGNPTSWTYLDGTSGQWRLSNAGKDRIAVTDTGNVGIGTNTPAARLDVSGNARADDFIFTTPKVRYMSFPPSAFIPRRPGLPLTIESASGGTFYESSVGSGNFSAPIQLPHGATITEISVWFIDNSPTVDLDARLLTRPFAGLSYSHHANAVTSGASTAVQEVTFSPNVVINNQSTAYVLSIFCSNWDGFNTQVKGARITYTVPSAD